MSRKGANPLADAWGIVKANILGIVILLSLLFIVKQVHYSRQVFLLFFILNCALLMLERLSIKVFLNRIRASGHNLKHILVIGAGNLGQQFVKKVMNNPFLGYSIAGFIDDNIRSGKQVEGQTVLAKLDGLENILQDHRLDEVIIALPIKEYDKLRYIIKVCEKAGVRTQIIPDYMKYIPARPLIDEIDGLPLLNTRYVPLDNAANALGKRLFDAVASGMGLLVCIPLFIVVGIAIKIESPGPVFFSQERVGLNRKHFRMYKFRSMKVQ
jgi:FlaA1/EpsC-like NDP-sugar epimerase